MHVRTYFTFLLTYASVLVLFKPKAIVKTATVIGSMLIVAHLVAPRYVFFTLIDICQKIAAI